MHNIWEMKSYMQMFETKLHQRNSYVGHLNLSMGWPKLHMSNSTDSKVNLFKYLSLREGNRFGTWKVKRLKWAEGIYIATTIYLL